MRTMSDRVRDRWAADEVALNAWSTFGGASAASVLAAAGFDAVTVDLQHGEHTLEQLGEVIGAIERAGAVPFVRLGWNDPRSVMRALDLGARGLICPMVDTAEDAAAFVRFCRYPPLGARSYGPVRSAFGTGREHTDASNAAVLAFAQIETAVGFGGFADLASREMLDALDRVVAAAAAQDVVPGIHAPTIERTVEMARGGFRFVGSAGDTELLRAGAAEIGR